MRQAGAEGLVLRPGPGDGFDPAAGDEFVALGQGVHAVPDPVRRFGAPGGGVEDLLGFEQDGPVLGGQFRHDRPEAIESVQPVENAIEVLQQDQIVVDLQAGFE